MGGGAHALEMRERESSRGFRGQGLRRGVGVGGVRRGEGAGGGKGGGGGEDTEGERAAAVAGAVDADARRATEQGQVAEA
jgi:hypothetical protein